VNHRWQRVDLIEGLCECACVIFGQTRGTRDRDRHKRHSQTLDGCALALIPGLVFGAEADHGAISGSVNRLEVLRCGLPSDEKTRLGDVCVWDWNERRGLIDLFGRSRFVDSRIRDGDRPDGQQCDHR
jgi:hypothetical protein